MFWDKKDDSSGLPDLPPLKEPPRWNVEEDSEESFEKNTLPRFPDSPSHNSFSQAAIKDAISDEKEISDEKVKQSEFKTMEMEEWNPKTIEREAVPELPIQRNVLPEPPKSIQAEDQLRKPFLNSSQAGNDIFVKIEKFRNVRKALNETKDKLEEIDELLKKIREVKMREEQELTSWEKEISNSKARIQQITSEIFEKVK